MAMEGCFNNYSKEEIFKMEKRFFNKGCEGKIYTTLKLSKYLPSVLMICRISKKLLKQSGNLMLNVGLPTVQEH